MDVPYVPSEDPELFLQEPANNAKIQSAMQSIDTFPDMHEVTSGIWLGNQTAAGILLPYEERDVNSAAKLRAARLKTLQDKKISLVICCSDDDAQPFKEEGIAYQCELLLDGGLLKCDPAEFDKANTQFAAFFEAAVKKMEAVLKSGDAVLVHCNSGANRSSSVVAGYMMLTQGKRFDEVMPVIFGKRPVVCPRYWQWLVENTEPKALGLTDHGLRKGLKEGGEGGGAERSVCCAPSPHTRHSNRQSGASVAFIWDENAAATSVTQIGTSACGATGLINVLEALGVDYDKRHGVISKAVDTRLRDSNASICRYLYSRSWAGCRADDIIEGTARLTQGRTAVTARFFHLYPRREVDVLKFLAKYLSEGCPVIATLNPQRRQGRRRTADAWHHQMIYGVGGNTGEKAIMRMFVLSTCQWFYFSQKLSMLREPFPQSTSPIP
jgi:hypothetical protein